MSLSDDLLLDKLQTLQRSMDALQSNQTATSAELHAAVSALDTRMTALDTRMTGMENSVRHFKADVRREARRWGAVGGAGAGIIAIAGAAVKWILSGPKIPHTG